MFSLIWSNLFLGYNIENHWKFSLKSLTFYTYTPFKKISKNKLKFKDKPWIISGMQKLRYIKNHHLAKFIRLNDPNEKEKSPNKINITEINLRD